MGDTNITALILSALNELNEQLPPGQQVQATSETALFGEGGALDSMSLVNLILLVEERVAGEFGVTVSLADERAMSGRASPFRSVKSLAEYVETFLKERPNG